MSTLKVFGAEAILLGLTVASITSSLPWWGIAGVFVRNPKALGKTLGSRLHQKRERRTTTRSRRGWDTAWCKLRVKTGLPDAQSYQLRHTSITAGAEENVPVQVMKSLAGHMGTQMTEYYTSIRDNPKARAVEAIEKSNPELLGILGLDEVAGNWAN